MCVLRSEGYAEAAEQLENTEFAQAAAVARQSAPTEFEGEAMLQQLLAEESTRVADAMAFAEFLLPMLVERLGAAAPAVPAPAPASPRRPSPAAAGESRGIADFIDDMLSQERRARA